MRALVTGAGQRLGRHLAEALGARGARVFVHYHSSEQGALETRAAIERAGGEAVIGRADLADPAEARDLVRRAISAFGGLDVLLVSAANFERIPLAELDDAGFARSLDLNLRAAFALAHEAAPALTESRGSMLFVTCTSSARPFVNYLAYSVSKGALKQLMLGLAQELAPHVRVNAIAPGTVLPPSGTTEDEKQRYARAALLDSIGSPDDIVRAALYLIDSPFVTGQELRVDGGRL